MNPPVERRVDSTERLIGVIEGRLQGIESSQERMETALTAHIVSEESYKQNMDARTKKLEMDGAERKGAWWGVSTIATIGGAVGAFLHKFSEQWWR